MQIHVDTEILETIFKNSTTAEQLTAYMLVSIAIAALSVLGAKANYGNALKIASSMPTGGLPREDSRLVQGDV